jgi:Nucleotidyl transferase AbiEii toxin, Type IV TA system
MSELGDLLFAVHDALDQARIPHAVGGAIALGYCTLEPRGTRDLDFNVFVGPDRAREVFAALPPGVEISGERLERFEHDGQVRLRAGSTPVDLFLSVLPFHDQVEREVRRVPFEGRTIPVLSCTALAVFKAMFDRPRDWVDIEAMVEAHSLDLDEARAWIREMIGEDRRLDELDAARDRRSSQGEPRPLPRPLRPPGRDQAG